MRQLLPLLLLLLFAAWSATPTELETLPCLYEGRCRPYIAIEKETPLAEAALLPSKGGWLPLNALHQFNRNPTLYPDATYDELRALFLLEREEVLVKTLQGSFDRLAGSQQFAGVGKAVTFPSKAQLYMEAFLYKIPVVLLLSIGYLLGAFSTPLLITTFSIHTLFLAARAFVLERPFVSNMAESLLFVSWGVVVAGFLLFAPRYVIAPLASVLLALFLLGNFGPSFDVVQAVLNSSFWLSTHVLLVCLSYALFLLCGLLSAVYLWKKAPTLLKPLLIALFTGLTALIGGTLLGGVWASQSWGRFWDWDPKEAWAFLSIAYYLALLHAFYFKILSPFGLALGTFLGMSIIAFTWYGVNYILGTGLHSYGFGADPSALWLFAGFVLVQVLFSAVVFLRRRHNRSS